MHCECRPHFLYLDEISKLPLLPDVHDIMLVPGMCALFGNAYIVLEICITFLFLDDGLDFEDITRTMLLREM